MSYDAERSNAILSRNHIMRFTAGLDRDGYTGSIYAITHTHHTPAQPGSADECCRSRLTAHLSHHPRHGLLFGPPSSSPSSGYDSPSGGVPGTASSSSSVSLSSSALAGAPSNGAPPLSASAPPLPPLPAAPAAPAVAPCGGELALAMGGTVPRASQLPLEPYEGSTAA